MSQEKLIIVSSQYRQSSVKMKDYHNIICQSLLLVLSRCVLVSLNIDISSNLLLHMLFAFSWIKKTASSFY